MSYNTTEPSNKNFLSPLGFKFSIKKTPNVNYFVQQISMPSVSLGSADMPTPFQRIPIAGTQLSFGDLSITFKVDENMQNYLELYNWLTAIGFPDNFNQYPGEREVYSDATLTILTSAYRPKYNVIFRDLYPIDLGGFGMLTTASDVDHVECVATFKYRIFDIVPATAS